MNSASKIVMISMGNKTYLDRDSCLDFLAWRSTLIIEELRRRNLPLGDTEFLRGQSFEQELLKHAIQPPTQVS